jgi:rsbT co-antagonist protein RsbR
MSIDLDFVLEHTPGLLFVADADGTLLRHSKAFADYFGVRLQSHQSLTTLAGPDERASVEAFLAELAVVDQAVTRVLRLPIHDGSLAEVRCVGRRAPGGTILAQLEILGEVPMLATAARIEHAMFRAIIETLDIVMWAIDRSGTFVFHDGKALATAGLQPNQFLGMNIFELYPAHMVDPVRQALNGTASTYTTEAHDVHWQSWNIPLEAGSANTDFVFGLTLDVSSSVRTKVELERRLATIEDQQRAIHELSAPVINVWDSVLTVPLIGVMDNERANELIERLLAAASRSSTRYVILDLTGVDALDTSIAGHLLRLLRSLRLLGVEGLVTGISPQVAQTMVGLGVELEDVRTFRSLRESLRYCMKAMYDEVVSD